MTLETGNAIWETRVEVRRTIEILAVMVLALWVGKDVWRLPARG